MDVVADSGVSADIGTTDFGLIFLMIVRLDRGQNVVVEIKIPVGIEHYLFGDVSGSDRAISVCRLFPAWRDRRKRSALWRADHRQGASLGSGPLVRDAQVAKALTPMRLGE